MIQVNPAINQPRNNNTKGHNNKNILKKNKIIQKITTYDNCSLTIRQIHLINPIEHPDNVEFIEEEAVITA